jgi:ATP-dependent DNA ligase
MLAQLLRGIGELPAGDMLYQPKWDGFRSIVFRDGPRIELASRNERHLTRYFPELAKGLLEVLPERIVVDGEIVIAHDGKLDFEALLLRIHPAESRIKLLADTMPAQFVVFDLLAVGDEDLRPRPLRERFARMTKLFAKIPPPVRLTPSTTDRELAADWFHRFEGAGLDGIVAKPMQQPYIEGKRCFFKVKHERTADCVVGGFRRHKDQDGVGSLLLGLYDENGTLHHVGVASGMAKTVRAELERELEPLMLAPGARHPWGGTPTDEQRIPGGPSRWTGTRDLSWIPVKPSRVVEVAYDHLQGDRFRHATHFRRWRPDRKPRSCTYDQLDRPVPAELARVFSA